MGTDFYTLYFRLVTLSLSYSAVTKELGLRARLAGFESWHCFRSKLFIFFVLQCSQLQKWDDGGYTLKMILNIKRANTPEVLSLARSKCSRNIIAATAFLQPFKGTGKLKKDFGLMGQYQSRLIPLRPIRFLGAQ